VSTARLDDRSACLVARAGGDHPRNLGLFSANLLLVGEELVPRDVGGVMVADADATALDGQDLGLPAHEPTIDVLDTRGLAPVDVDAG